MSLLHGLLPQYQFAERHQRRVAATPAALMQALAQLPQWQDPWISRFIALRELPGRLVARLGYANALPHKPPFGLHEFTLLAQGEHELVWGLAGEFWRSDYGLQPIADAASFAALPCPRLVLGFTVSAQPDGQTLLCTETRVACPTQASYRRFWPYWYLIRPVSGLIRQRILRAVAGLALAQQASHLGRDSQAGG